MNESESENKFKEVAQRFRLNASLLAARIFTFTLCLLPSYAEKNLVDSAYGEGIFFRPHYRGWPY
ncbi:MAG: hypothetical protein AUG51_06140 [Acidobacteria bacterium 13_1_20CM_3_53_8]|nr:MAG: hypothetical protein AUG51_06140 [Acidobacteria bacterium 13_1_20CM_3_53_8]